MTMTRLSIIVEGQTEESFVHHMLGPYLNARNVFTSAIILGRPGKKGGIVAGKLEADIVRRLKENHGQFVSTMIDFYGLPSRFPGMPVPERLSTTERGQHVEAALRQHIGAQMGGNWHPHRFIPYVQMHEFEGLLFSNPVLFANAIHRSDLAAQFHAVRAGFDAPEDINDGSETAPSKRIKRLYPGYQKVTHGLLAALALGLDALIDQCPHFRQWVEKLSGLAATPS